MIELTDKKSVWKEKHWFLNSDLLLEDFKSTHANLLSQQMSPKSYREYTSEVT